MVTLPYLYSCYPGDFPCRRPKQLPTHVTKTASSTSGSGRIAGKYPTVNNQLSAPRNKLIFQLFILLAQDPNWTPIPSPRRRISNHNGGHIPDSQTPLLTHRIRTSKLLEKRRLWASALYKKPRHFVCCSRLKTKEEQLTSCILALTKSQTASTRLGLTEH